MILLSTCANIVSKMTAFVAIDKGAMKKVEGEMVKRPCPIPVATQEFIEMCYENNLKSYCLMDCGFDSGVPSSPCVVI